MVWEEAELVIDRLNGVLAAEGSILQGAASTAVAAFGKDGGKSARKEFMKLIERLSGSGDPEPKRKNLTEQLLKERKGNGR